MGVSPMLQVHCCQQFIYGNVYVMYKIQKLLQTRSTAFIKIKPTLQCESKEDKTAVKKTKHFPHSAAYCKPGVINL